MDKYKFIERIKNSITEQDMRSYKEEIFSPNNGDEKWASTRFKASVQSWDEEQQQFFLSYIRTVVDNSVGLVLSVLDGATNIGDSGGQFQLYYDEEDGQRTHINDKDGDMLMTLFMDEDEDEVTN